MISIIIIETSSHAECIFSQVLFLKNAGHSVHFIGGIKLKERVEQLNFDKNSWKNLTIIF